MVPTGGFCCLEFDVMREVNYSCLMMPQPGPAQCGAVLFCTSQLTALVNFSLDAAVAGGLELTRSLSLGVAKFVESVGGKLEFWFFDYGKSTAYSVIEYPDEVAAAGAAKHKCGWFRACKNQAVAFGRGYGQGCCKDASRPSSTTAINDRRFRRFSRVSSARCA
jgi:hypothetical protein